MDALEPLWFHGQMMIALFAGTTLGGYSDPVNSVDLNLTHSGDAKPLISSGVDNLGQMIHLDYMPKPTEIEFTVNQSNRALLAASLLGTGSTFSQAADAAGEATVTLIRDAWVQIVDADGNPVRHISDVAIATMTEDEDFAVLPTLGMVKALTAGATGEQDLTYKAAALTGDTIIAGTEGSISFAIQMEVKNHSTGNKGFLRIPKVTVLPAEAAKLVNENRNQLKFKGFVIQLPGSPVYQFDPVVSVAA
jgi:hypothetical protein